MAQTNGTVIKLNGVLKFSLQVLQACWGSSLLLVSLGSVLECSLPDVTMETHANLSYSVNKQERTGKLAWRDFQMRCSTVGTRISCSCIADKIPLSHGFANPGRQVAKVTEFCTTLAPDIFWSSLEVVFLINLVASTVLRRLRDLFYKICACLC